VTTTDLVERITSFPPAGGFYRNHALIDPAALDRQADVLLQQGMHRQAERLSWRAEALREVAGE
jgi:hypothetical protein